MSLRHFLFSFSCALASALAMPGCIEAAQEPVTYEAVAVSRGDGTAVVDGWTVTLSRATVALGPFYFCAAASGSSTLCKSSIAEVRNVAVIDALARAPTRIGSVEGFTGTIQSASFDFGISWFDTQVSATPAPSLPQGHSMRLEGEARKGNALISFTADVDVVPQYQGQHAISTAPAVANVTSGSTRLEIVLEPAAWLKQLDFETIAARGKDPFPIDPSMPEHGAVLLGIKNVAPLEFRWARNNNP